MTQIAAARPTFAGVKEWPEPAPAVAGIGHNNPPLDEMIVLEFEEAIDAKPGLRTRINELIDKGGKLPNCTDEDMAGRLGDFVKMVGNAHALVDAERETIKAPYLAATRALDGKANGYKSQLTEAKTIATAKLNAFMQEKARKAEIERKRIADEMARRREEADRREAAARLEREEAQAAENARAAAEQREAEVVAAPEPEPMAEPTVEAPKVEVPVVHGDYGARVGMRAVWLHSFESVRKLPTNVLQHPTVTEAINKVLAQRIRGGEREIAGVKIWPEQMASVR